jgi:hypothetical protein
VEGFEVYGPGDKRKTVDHHETLLVNLIMGNARNMAIDVPVENGVLSIGNVQSKSKLGCKAVNGRITLVGKISIRGNLA